MQILLPYLIRSESELQHNKSMFNINTLSNYEVLFNLSLFNNQTSFQKSVEFEPTLLKIGELLDNGFKPTFLLNVLEAIFKGTSSLLR